MPKFSFLLPTRGNLEGVNRLFQSLVETTDRLDDLEIVLAVDDDDLESQAINHDQLTLKKVVLPRGATMGTLNRACFELSTGRYVMLINDDIVLRTKGWDTTIAGIFAEYDDDIALIHVNDLLFREKLCTFPMLSRRACLAIGICPAEYRRYRIDDHIYDAYSLLAYLGYRRILYLPDVIFEHQNHTARPDYPAGHLFRSMDNKVYSPNQAIIELDARQFDATLEVRKQDALRLAALIDEYRHTSLQTRQQAALSQIDPQRKSAAYQCLLEGIRDSYSYRRSEFVKQRPSAPGALPPKARTTIAVVTSDLRKEYAAKCLALIKEHTHNYDLLILDNSYREDFSHTREMNKILRMVDTNFLVLMDDDVFVEPSWLERMLRCIDDQTGLVAPLHRDRRGVISFSGVYFAGDGLGTHEHLLDKPDRPRVVQTVCSALILIDMRKCAHFFMDEVYMKYFLDLDYSLQVWEAGYQVMVTPEVTVTHIGGATMVWGSAQANSVQERDRRRFVETWIQTGRLAKLERGIWQNYPTLRPLVEIPTQINQFFDQLPDSDFHSQLTDLVHAARGHALFRKLMATRLEDSLPSLERSGDVQKLAHSRAVLRSLREMDVVRDQRSTWEVYRNYVRLFIATAKKNPRLAVHKAWMKLFGPKYANQPMLVVDNYRGFNIIHYQHNYYGLALALGPVYLQKLSASTLNDHQRNGMLVMGRSVREVIWWILLSAYRRYLMKGITLARKEPLRAAKKALEILIGSKYADRVELVTNNYRGFNIVHYRQVYYGLALTLGPMDLETVSASTLQEYQRNGLTIIGSSAAAVKSRIWRAYLQRVLALARRDPKLLLRKVIRKLSGPLLSKE